jgi:nucleotide-binding universal stress UspA family protein
MYNKVLVPLDGSQLAECSLAQLESIVSGSVTEVVLMRVVEPVLSYEASAWAQAGYSAIEVENKNMSDARGYLSHVADKLIDQGINARGDVLLGRAAESILDYAEKNQFDLIVVSTHGRSGVSRWAFGSVAEKIAHYSVIPVLIVTASGCRDKK